MDLEFRAPRPVHRRLRVYAFDPSLGTQLETAAINQLTLKVPWEDLGRGPVGEYLEVVDYDPASGCFYAPVDLNDGHVLAQDGLAPSEGSPQFHQQMVYAVAMRTIRNFELALGRLALWSPKQEAQDEFIQRLRIYPHALRDANAYYSPDKKGLLFGYFRAPGAGGGGFPGGMVFTCLSHDVVAHETSHALLDGMHRRFNEPSNPDMWAFHEAFADIVALFQHFSWPEVLRHQIAKTRGDLERQSLLGELAQQFGQALGHYGALRSAIGAVNPETGQWERLRPSPEAYEKTLEPHDRGAILVAAIFDAFLAIYQSRVADLVRIASGGTGVLAPGEVHPDLVNRLAEEAAKTAQHVLTICIRALDYCPPVDLTFGEYLRALITADSEAVPDDPRGYRAAFIEAFRRRGIYPRDVRTLSVESLRWHPPSEDPGREVFLEFVRELKAEDERWELAQSRRELFDRMEALRAALHERLKGNLAAEPEVCRRIEPSLPFEVHSLRPCQRVGPDGELIKQWVIEITQRRKEYLDEGPESAEGDDEREWFWFRGGSTWIVEAGSGRVRYVIEKNVNSANRLARQRRFLRETLGQSLGALYFDPWRAEIPREPFAILHRSY